MEICKACNKEVKELWKVSFGITGYSVQCCLSCSLDHKNLKNLPRTYTQPVSVNYLESWEEHQKLHSRR